jgi:hypothetical protein
MFLFLLLAICNAPANFRPVAIINKIAGIIGLEIMLISSLRARGRTRCSSSSRTPRSGAPS